MVAVLWHTAVHFFFFFYEGAKPRRTTRFGSARRVVESSTKHWFSIWQRAEKRKERLLSSSTPPHIFPHPFYTDPSFVPSSLSIDLNVTQPWHGFTRLLAGRVFYIFYDSFPFLVSSYSYCLRFYDRFCYFVFRFGLFFSCVVPLPLYMHLTKYEI